MYVVVVHLVDIGVDWHDILPTAYSIFLALLHYRSALLFVQGVDGSEGKQREEEG